MATLSGTTAGGHKYLQATDPPDLPAVSQAMALAMDDWENRVHTVETAVASSGATVAFRRLVKTSAQSLSTGVATGITWSTGSGDPGDASGITLNTTTGVLTCTQAGAYLVELVGNSGAGISTAVRAGGIVVASAVAQASNSPVFTLTATVRLTAGQTIDARAHTSSTTQWPGSGSFPAEGAADVSSGMTTRVSLTVTRLGG